ncbi:uncharacterized protein LOC123317161 [Coccinella septempunctata]|uniref:uncharacterized protein LOC123317161 n=1 Tax=Coccinella septempunctata TaxID=41139 RepID=UPI001D05E803|nr:uncharacterized protein LOC123317161 [Coccinella septempunctata]
MQISTIFQVSVLLLFYFLTAVYALKCFQCNSFDNPECLTLKNNDTDSEHYKECPKLEGNVTFCRKLYQQLENDEKTERVRRSCGWILHKEPKDHCWRADTDFKKERNCQCFGDACNTSYRTEYSFSACLVAVVAFLLYI